MWERLAWVIQKAVTRIRKEGRLHPVVKVMVILRNDTSDDQLVGGTFTNLEEQKAFLRRALERLETEAAFEDVRVVNGNTGDTIPSAGDA